MIDAVRTRFGIAFDERPLVEVQLLFFTQELFRARNGLFLFQRRSRGIFRDLVLEREERTIWLEFDGVLFGLAIAEITRLPHRSRHLLVVNLVHAGDSQNKFADGTFDDGARLGASHIS